MNLENPSLNFDFTLDHQSHSSLKTNSIWAIVHSHLAWIRIKVRQILPPPPYPLPAPHIIFLFHNCPPWNYINTPILIKPLPFLTGWPGHPVLILKKIQTVRLREPLSGLDKSFATSVPSLFKIFQLILHRSIR